MTSLGTQRTLILSTLVWLFSVSGCKGCGDDESAEPAGNAVEENAAVPPQPPSAPSPPQSALGKDVDFLATRVEGKREVLGHLVVSNLEGTLSRARTQIKLPSLQPYLSTQAVRAMLTLPGVSPRFLEHVHLDAPIGCALADPKTYETPGVCYFYYEGGLAQLVQDVDGSARVEDAQGHAARYRLEDEEIYLDQVGDALVASGHPDLFDKTKSYLAEVLIPRKIALDLEIVVNMTEVTRHYPEEVEQFLKSADAQKRTLSTSALNEHLKAQQVENMQRVLEIDQYHFQLGLDSAGMAVRFAMFAAPGTYYGRYFATMAGGKGKHEILERLPETTMAAFASEIDWFSPYTDERLAAEQSSMTAKVFAALTGEKEAEVAARLKAFFRQSSRDYAPPMAVALLNQPGSVGAIVMVASLEGEKSAREHWRAWAEEFGAERSSERDEPQEWTWRFEPAAVTVDGIEVDRWVVEATEEGKTQLESRVSSNPRLAELGRRMGTWTLTVDRIEKGGEAAWILYPGQADGVVESVLSALGGERSLGQDQVLEAVTRRYPATSHLGLLDVKAGLRWVQQSGLTGAGSVPVTVGQDLSDVVVPAIMTKEALHAELFLSQTLVNHLVSLAQLAQLAAIGQ